MRLRLPGRLGRGVQRQVAQADGILRPMAAAIRAPKSHGVRHALECVMRQRFAVEVQDAEDSTHVRW